MNNALKDLVNVFNHNTGNLLSGMGFVIIERYLLRNSQAAMGVFHGGSNDHFLAQWGLFLRREGVQLREG